MQGKLKVLCGSSHKHFAEEVCKHMSIELSAAETITFSNENMLVRILDNVRESDVFVVQTSAPPVSDGIMEMFLMLDALKHSSAARVTAVIPYYPYVRSDKKDQPRISIAARLMADLLQTAGADRVLTMELHSPQIQGFFHIPADHLNANEVICDYYRAKDMTDHIIVAADVGEAKHLGRYANRLNLPMAIIDKRREGNSESVVPTNLIGDVKGKHCLIIDDEVASAGTLCSAAEFLIEKGAKSTHAAIVHPVLSGNAIERINNSALTEVVVTDSIPLHDKVERCPKLKVLSVAPLFSKAIHRIHNGDSLSVLFK